MLKQLGQLPRDCRDTLFLLLVTAWVVLPQVAYLPLWCTLLARMRSCTTAAMEGGSWRCCTPAAP